MKMQLLTSFQLVYFVFKNNKPEDILFLQHFQWVSINELDHDFALRKMDENVR